MSDVRNRLGGGPGISASRCVALSQADLPRTFRTPGMPAIGVVFSIWLITFLTPLTWFVAGLLIHFRQPPQNGARPFARTEQPE